MSEMPLFSTRTEPDETDDNAVLAGTIFQGWIRRQDCRGRWGWERPGLSDAECWWRRWDFDDLDG